MKKGKIENKLSLVGYLRISMNHLFYNKLSFAFQAMKIIILKLNLTDLIQEEKDKIKVYILNLIVGLTMFNIFNIYSHYFFFN